MLPDNEQHELTTFELLLYHYFIRIRKDVWLILDTNGVHEKFNPLAIERKKPHQQDQKRRSQELEKQVKRFEQL